MSSEPKVPSTPPDERTPITVPRLAEMKASGEPIVMVTAYDYPSALVVEEAGVDVVLVGDTAAMVVLGHDSTTPVGMDEMVTMAALATVDELERVQRLPGEVGQPAELESRDG